MTGLIEAPRIRHRYEVYGVVQGVGFRPFVYVTAADLSLSGSVGNTDAGVVIEVEGEPAAVVEFARRLSTDAPPLAVVDRVVESELEPQGGTGFAIDQSRDSSGATRTLASPDIATCADCLAELGDPGNRRYRHPFITCTNCGPRFTIIVELPYDRHTTTMASFPMCAACRAEYEDPTDRRFHAQPIACPDCGPTLELRTSNGAVARGDEVVAAARQLLADGHLLAVKGLGGHHLVCDARNTEAVGLLRVRKGRGDKPFAVMVANLEVARSLVEIGDTERALLTGIRRPIVLLPARPEPLARQLASAVAPGNPDLGVMLPYTPIHTLLFGVDADAPGPDVLVMTSGNASGEPIVTDDDEAMVRLAPFVDAWLTHDRRIHVPCDDSVTRIVRAVELPVRRSRGFAPLPVALPFEVGPTLAVGADLKNTCAVAAGRYAWLSQHVGDMDDLATIEAFTRTEQHLETLTGVVPEELVADRHPGYRSGEWARSHADGRPVRTVQHHHAHIASVMGEHGLDAGERVIGVAFDGTGYGDDGAVWGGEVLLASYKSFRRAAHLGYVPLAGGDASVLRPYRMALAHLHAAGLGWDERLAPVQACPVVERDVLTHQFGTGFGCVPTSSMGRLFDAVSSIAGVRQRVDYEAEAAIELEGLARAGTGAASHRYRFRLDDHGRDAATIADPGPVVRAVVEDVLADVPVPQIARAFHHAVATLIVDLAEVCREQTSLSTVALGGGVFQNALLVELADAALTEAGFSVLLPRVLPPNDGGIALGQILIGASA